MKKNFDDEQIDREMRFGYKYELKKYQIETAKRVALGETNEGIARYFGMISKAGIDKRLSRIYSKVGVKNRTELIFLAKKEGIIPDQDK